QQRQIQMRVLSDTGTPLAGASVYRLDGRGKRVSVLTKTDDSGHFAYSPELIGTQLEVVYVGYQQQKITASERGGDIALKLLLTEVDEVEVVFNTGYQQLPKERATGSFGVVSESQIDKPTLNIGQRLIGTMGGVQANLDVDGNPTFEIRGQTSLFASAEPLVVVDGFPIQGGFESINPNDVESITVLKDAA